MRVISSREGMPKRREPNTRKNSTGVKKEKRHQRQDDARDASRERISRRQEIKDLHYHHRKEGESGKGNKSDDGLSHMHPHPMISFLLSNDRLILLQDVYPFE
jgi:hypothetical protein